MVSVSVDFGDIRQDGIVHIKLDRPHVGNALCIALLTELHAALDKSRSIVGARVVLLEGAGSKAFCTGADIKEASQLSSGKWLEWGDQFIAVLEQLRDLPLPVIAVLKGYASGAGAALVLHSDLVVMAESAHLGFQEINLGLMGGAYFLPHVVGRQVAAEMTLLGGYLDSTRAWGLGLCNRVVPDKDVDMVAQSIAHELVAKSPQSLALAKRSLAAGRRGDPDLALRYHLGLQALALASEDAREGIAAFMQKRKPRFASR